MEDRGRLPTILSYFTSLSCFGPGAYVKRLTKRWDCPETDYDDHHKLDPDPDSLNTPPHNILNFKSTSLDYVQTQPSSSSKKQNNSNVYSNL
ncbi:hypothetical protein BY996DRAFT_6490719 [Phakopsora pachyrhizi]|nr:hypothetical protein BY996DRAFT_6490719 [Phakopsora pachyrhizi]